MLAVLLLEVITAQFISHLMVRRTLQWLCVLASIMHHTEKETIGVSIARWTVSDVPNTVQQLWHLLPG